MPGVKTPARSRIQRLLASYRIRRLSADGIREALDVPSLRLAPGAAEAASEHVLLILPILRLLRHQRKDLEHRIETLLDEMCVEGKFAEHRDVTILRSLPGVGRVITATMLAEASEALAKRDYHALRCYGGTAPVTRRSGKRELVVMRQGCNQRVRNALYHWSRVSTQHDERSQQHYAALRAKGHSHGRALRGVADRLLGVLMAMLKTGTTYDPGRRPAVATC
jgi:transposase